MDRLPRMAHTEKSGTGREPPSPGKRELLALALDGAKRAPSSRQRLEFDDRLQVIRALYWQLRYLRPTEDARRRRLYRAIRDEREKFDGTAFDGELLRLFCRYLANPGSSEAERRYLMRLSSAGQD